MNRDKDGYVFKEIIQWLSSLRSLDSPYHDNKHAVVFIVWCDTCQLSHFTKETNKQKSHRKV
jgi:hypothetical protein